MPRINTQSGILLQPYYSLWILDNIYKRLFSGGGVAVGVVLSVVVFKRKCMGIRSSNTLTELIFFRTGVASLARIGNGLRDGVQQLPT